MPHHSPIHPVDRLYVDVLGIIIIVLVKSIEETKCMSYE